MYLNIIVRPMNLSISLSLHLFIHQEVYMEEMVRGGNMGVVGRMVCECRCVSVARDVWR